MDTLTLFEILSTHTPQEMTDSIMNNGKKKLVNAIAFINKESNEQEKGDKEHE